MKRKLIKWKKYEIENEDDEFAPIAFGPMGPIPMMLPEEMNLWIGVTNFKLTDQDINKIKVLEGVESLDILTPYRLRVGVAQHTNEIKVLKKIDRVVCGIAYPLSKKKVENEVVKFMLNNHIDREWCVAEDDGVLYILDDINNRADMKILAVNINNNA